MTFRGSLLLFADDFEAAAAPPPSPAPEPPPPPPSYGQDELDAARAEADAAGYARGIADAAATDAARVSEALATIAERLADAAASAARATDESAGAIAQLVLASVLAGYPELGKRHGLEEVRALVRLAMPGLLLEPRVTFRVHPTMVRAVTDELAAVPPDERRHMTIEPWDGIAPGDAHITWPHGGAVRKAGDVRAAIADILRPLGLLPEPEPASTDPETR
jgi:flagellar assembly protein FliH